ncbi:phosphatidylinositol-glycan biosynthesis class W protein-like [Littorina saxatilis]|uniref:Phosphatidylinositol-glycan biosynthesis class W protein n=1 Tax=Littorina saxatilis TaxID=31220 RepID=A0AAN9B7C6_9CAEN
MASYKKEHEQFVSGHNGTTVAEVAVMTITPCACLLLRDILLLVFGLRSLPLWPRVVLDFSLVVVPAILMDTVLSHVTSAVSIILFCAAFVSCVFALLYKKNANLAGDFNKVLNMEMESQRPFLNYTRALMNISTAILILGVDFPAFPRRFAKTETFGTGYMDIGVGCFVISNALVSPESRGRSNPCQSAKEFVHRAIRSVQSSLPLLVFGFGRLIAVKGTDYHEHVTEYGVHWNFFFTLAIVKVASTALLCICPVRLSTAVAVLFMSAYQYALSNMGLTDYILHGRDGSGSRQGLLDANREGILSSFGYIALYLIGVQLGSLIFSKKKQTFMDWGKTFLLLLLISAVSYISQSLSSTMLQPTSRRMANITFVFWIVGLSVQVMWSCLAVDLASTAISALVIADRKKIDVPSTEAQLLSVPGLKSATPCMLHAVNANGLFYFLLSNVMTGVVNMSIPAHHMSAAVAVSALLLYTFVLSGVIVYMDKKKIYTKFW